ncbi:hypothetical protein LBMAG21_09570 [Armatimonadota bacterium]|nr:hypothetical protein LBMAG21_09570 [Armatimonadota bacterium]
MGTVRYNVINGRVLSETRSGVRRDYLTDGLGNTLALLDNTQTKTDTFDYFPSGTVAVRTGTTPTPFQWVGGQGYFKDSGTRTYVRARNFHNNLGRWGSQDPIGFNAGDFNLYQYVNNRFVVLGDPSGLHPSCIITDKTSALQTDFKVIADYNPLIKEAVQEAMNAFQAQRGDCSWKCIAKFIKKTIKPTNNFALFMGTSELLGCLQQTLTYGGHRCDLSVDKVADVDSQGEPVKLTGCQFNNNGALCAHAPEMSAPFGPTTWCIASFDDLNRFIPPGKKHSCNDSKARMDTAIHEAIHICSYIFSFR